MCPPETPVEAAQTTPKKTVNLYPHFRWGYQCSIGQFGCIDKAAALKNDGNGCEGCVTHQRIMGPPTPKR